MIGRISTGKDDLLRREDVQRLYRIMQKHAEMTKNVRLEPHKQKRRAMLESLDLEEYRRIVLEMVSKEADIMDDI